MFPETRLLFLVYIMVVGAPAITSLTQVGKKRRKGLSKGDLLIETVPFKEFKEFPNILPNNMPIY